MHIATIAAHSINIFFIVLLCLLFVFGLLFHLCIFALHHCKTFLQFCKSVSHHCIGRCTAAKWPRTTAKRVYSIAKRPRTIAKRFCSVVSCPCIGAGRDCTAIPSPRRAARVPRRPACRCVCGVGDQYEKEEEQGSPKDRRRIVEGSKKAKYVFGGVHCSQRSLLRLRCHQMMRPTRMRAMGGMIIRPLFS